MTDDLNSGAEGASEGLSLRETLAAAMRGDAGGSEPAHSASPSDEGASPRTPEAPRADRTRDDQGRFAAEGAQKPQAATKATETAPAAAQAQAATPAAPAAPEAQQEQPAAAAESRRPPPSWSPTAKAAFGALPAEVQEAVAKREAEVDAGFAKLADYKGLEGYAEMAKQSGTTLQTAFDAYHRAESVLRQDFVGGVSQLCQTFQKHPVEVAAGLLQVHPQALVAALRGGQPAAPQAQGQEQPGQSGQPTPQQPGIDPRLVQIIDQQGQAIRSLTEAETNRQTAAQKASVAQTQSVIDAFFNDTAANPYATNLEAVIVDLVSRDPQARADLPGALKRAYDTAVWMHPETRQLAINEQLKANQAQSGAATAKATDAARRAREASRSLTGSPVAGAASAADQPAPTLRDELRRAMAAHRA